MYLKVKYSEKILNFIIMPRTLPSVCNILSTFNGSIFVDVFMFSNYIIISVKIYQQGHIAMLMWIKVVYISSTNITALVYYA